MVNRMAGAMALLAFVVCLVVGGFQADNSFATTVQRALTAMAVTLVIGLVLGAMASKMLDENLKSQEEKLKKGYSKVAKDDR